MSVRSRLARWAETAVSFLTLVGTFKFVFAIFYVVTGAVYLVIDPHPTQTLYVWPEPVIRVWAGLAMLGSIGLIASAILLWESRHTVLAFGLEACALVPVFLTTGFYAVTSLITSPYRIATFCIMSSIAISSIVRFYVTLVLVKKIRQREIILSLLEEETRRMVHE